MLGVSNAFKAAMIADERYSDAKVDVYFNGDGSAPVTFVGDDLSSVRLLDEASAESDNPLGTISSNELVLKLTNDDDRFSTQNALSPYFGKLLPNVLVEYFLGAQISGGTFEYVSMGKFRTSDWDIDNANMEATTVCNDRLYTICQLDLPQIAVQANLQLKDMFVVLFTAIGLSPTDYVIDPSLTQVITIGWFPDGKVRDALQAMALGGSCSVTVNRANKISVKNMLTHGASVLTITGDDNVYDSTAPQSFTKVYSSVNVLCKVPYLKEVTKVLTLSSVIVPTGSLFLTRLRFNDGPVANIMQFNILNGVHTLVRNISYGAWDITVELYNGGPQEIVDLEILGKLIAFTKSEVKLINSIMYDVVGEKCLTVESDFIQDLTFADTYCTSILKLVSEPAAYVSADVFGNPELELGDVITIDDPTNQVNNTAIVLTRITYDYDGAVEGTVYGIKTSALI